MKNLPRFVSIVLAIILTCGCSILEPVPDQSDVTQNEGTTTSTVKPVDEPSAVSEEEPEKIKDAAEAIKNDITDAVNQIADSIENAINDISSEGTIFSKTGKIDETVIYDIYGIKIIANEIEYKDYTADLKLTIENNTNIDLSFLAGVLAYSCNSINGYMVDSGYLNCDVNAGKKAKAALSFDYDSLLIYGITEIADLEIGIKISDSDYNDVDQIVYPLKTTLAASHDYTPDYFQTAIRNKALMNQYSYTIPYSNNETIYDQNGISIVCETLLSKGSESLLLLEAKNSTAETVDLETSHICINGINVQSYTYSSHTINPGKTCIMDLTTEYMMDSSLYPYFGINSIESISMNITQKNANYESITSPQKITVQLADNVSPVDDSGTEIYNQNGVRIIYKGIYEEEGFSIYYHAEFLIINSNGFEICINDEYNSLSVNDYMVHSWNMSKDVSQNEACAYEYDLSESSLKEIGITSPDQIEKIEFQIEITDSNYNTIDNPVLVIYP